MKSSSCSARSLKNKTYLTFDNVPLLVLTAWSWLKAFTFYPPVFCFWRRPSCRHVVILLLVLYSSGLRSGRSFEWGLLHRNMSTFSMHSPKTNLCMSLHGEMKKLFLYVQKHLVLCCSMVQWMPRMKHDITSAVFFLCQITKLKKAKIKCVHTSSNNHESLQFILFWPGSVKVSFIVGKLSVKLTLSFLYQFSLTPFSGSSWTSRLSGNCLFNLCLCVWLYTSSICMN